MNGVKTLQCTTLTLVAARLQTFLSTGNVVQRSVERVTLSHVPLDVVCGVVGYFEHVEELKCKVIRPPQQVHLLVVLHPCGYSAFGEYTAYNSY